MKVKRKQFMTLLETLTAAALLSIVLTILFGFFKQLSDLQILTESKQEESFQSRYVESRLGYIFQRITKDSKKNKKEHFYFYLEQPNHSSSLYPSLVFTFDNGVRSDPALSGEVVARLYVDSKGALCLATWPLYGINPKEHGQFEVLLTGIKNIEFSFYMPPEQKSSGTAVKANAEIKSDVRSPQKDEWNLEWLKEYEQMPGILKMTLTLENPEDTYFKKDEKESETKTLVLAFVLPTRLNPIYYPPGGDQ